MTDLASLLAPDRGQKGRLIHLVDKTSFEGWAAKRSASDRKLLAAREKRVTSLVYASSFEVYGKPELSTTVYVSDDGTIPVPLAGGVQVAGQSPARAAQSIATAFRKGGLLVDPQVTVFLVQSRSQQVSVLGAVRTPGRFAVESRTTVLDVLAQAGGATGRTGAASRSNRYSIQTGNAPARMYVQATCCCHPS